MKLAWEIVLSEKPVGVPLCPPQIPHGLSWDQTWTSAARCRWLTAWAMAWPYPVHYTVNKIFECMDCPMQGAGPEAIYNLFVFKHYVIKIM
jgi:hypothetical protein